MLVYLFILSAILSVSNVYAEKNSNKHKRKYSFTMGVLSSGIRLTAKDKSNCSLWSIVKSLNIENLENSSGNLVFGQKSDYADSKESESKIRPFSSAFISWDYKKHKKTSFGLFTIAGISKMKANSELKNLNTTITMSSPNITVGPVFSIYSKHTKFNIGPGFNYATKSLILKPSITLPINPTGYKNPGTKASDIAKAEAMAKEEYKIKSKFISSFSPAIYLGFEQYFGKKIAVHVSTLFQVKSNANMKEPENEISKAVFKDGKKASTYFTSLGIGLVYKY